MKNSSLKYQTIIFSIIIIGIVLRLLLANILPLTADEAHYALYALHLDWSYFDHPPLVGWLQALPLLWGDSEWLMRLMPILLHTITALILIKICQLLFPQQKLVPLACIVLYELSIMLQLMSLSLLPDTPLIVFTLLSLLSFYYATQHNQLKHWLGLGVCLGLMGLSKYPAILIPIGYLLWIVIYQRNLLLNSKLWLSLVIGLVLITPVIIWNIQNDWISIQYQFNHGEIANNSLNLIAFLKNQFIHLIVYSPVIFIFLWMVIIQFLLKRNIFQQLSTQKFIDLPILLSIPYLLIFTYSSAKGGHYLPHWISLSIVIMLPVIAQQLLCWIYPKNNKEHRKTQKIFIGGLIALSIILWLVFLLLIAGKLGQKINNEVWRTTTGWKESSIIAKKEAINRLKQPVIFVANWSEASQVAWYAKPIPVLSVDNRNQQFNIWYKKTYPQTPADKFPQEGILLIPPWHDEKQKTLEQWQQCQLLQTITYKKFTQLYPFEIFYCQKPQTSPKTP